MPSIKVLTSILLPTDPQAPMEAVTKQYVDNLSLGGNTSLAEYTYFELAELCSNNQLTTGINYILTDYYTKYIQPQTNKIKICEFDADTITEEQMATCYEKLLLTAASSNTFMSKAISLSNFGHEVIYDFNDTSLGQHGNITRRIDTQRNISIPWDYLRVKWARFAPLEPYVISQEDQSYPENIVTEYTGIAEAGKFYTQNGELFLCCSDFTAETLSMDNAIHLFRNDQYLPFHSKCLLPRSEGFYLSLGFDEIRYWLRADPENYYEYYTFQGIDNGNLTTENSSVQKDVYLANSCWNIVSFGGEIPSSDVHGLGDIQDNTFFWCGPSNVVKIRCNNNLFFGLLEKNDFYNVNGNIIIGNGEHNLDLLLNNNIIQGTLNFNVTLQQINLNNILGEFSNNVLKDSLTASNLSGPFSQNAIFRPIISCKVGANCIGNFFYDTILNSSIPENTIGNLLFGSAKIKTTSELVAASFNPSGEVPVSDGDYTIGVGITQNGVITVKGGIITSIQEAI